jgi:hypothetical protein
MIHKSQVTAKIGRTTGNKKAYWLELSEINKIRGRRFDPPISDRQAIQILGYADESQR